MNVEILRLLWSIVSEISPDRATGLSDDDLISSLIHNINNRVCLSREDQTAVRSYLSMRKPLIRDVLQK
ncbi:MAG: hypothetical protein AAFQ89_15665 [Cyanobacteria bacterium J06626_18]